LGYYTQYELKVSNFGESKNGIIDHISTKELSDIIFMILSTDPDSKSFEFVSNDRIKWYTFKEDMVELSLMFPDVLFELKGEGEEFPDLWVAYFKKGMMQCSKAKIRYPKFKESSLCNLTEED